MRTTAMKQKKYGENRLALGRERRANGVSRSEPTPFTLKVMANVRMIPKGKVATYKQIAGLSGKPHASRGVAWILNSCAKKYKLPWQRVLGSKGRISFKAGTRNYKLQKLKLRQEGVKFLHNDDVDMEKFQWSKKAPRPRNQPRMFA